jgi:hypothetical protein
MAVVEKHIEEFVGRFVMRAHASGWLSAYARGGSHWASKLRKFERQLERRRCEECATPLQSLADESRALGVHDVVFSDGDGTRRVAVDDVASEWSSGQGDAIVSLVPGKSAIFLFHEGWGWICREGAKGRR